MVEEAAARSCDFVAAVEVEVPGYKAALNPSLTDLTEISALVCTPVGFDFLLLIEKVNSDKDLVVRQPDL